MVAENLVPGVMRCAKCEFQLVRTNLYVNSGTTGPGDSKTEPCPNGCGPLWPVTWKQWAEEAQKTAERFLEEAKAERAKLDEMAMLVRRLVHSLKRIKPDSELPAQAMDYLRRHGLQGSPLRESPTQETPAESSADAVMAKVRQHFDERRCSCKDFPGADEFCTAHKVETFPSPPISPWPSSQQFDCLKCANGQTLTYMIVCPTCGNKRCPKASDHDLDCTNSNAPGQPGSQF